MRRRLLGWTLAATVVVGWPVSASPTETGTGAVEAVDPAFSVSFMGDDYEAQGGGRTTEPTPNQSQYSTGEWLDLIGPGQHPIRIHRMEGALLASVGEAPHVGLAPTAPVTVNSKNGYLVRQDDGGLSVAWVEADGVEYTVSSASADAGTLLHVAERVQEN